MPRLPRPLTIPPWGPALLLIGAAAVMMTAPEVGTVAAPPAEPDAEQEFVLELEVLAAVRVRPKDAAERAVARSLTDDVWGELEDTIDIVADAAALEALRARGVAFDVLLPDIQAPARAERARLQQAELASPSSRAWFEEYRDVEAVDAFVDTLAAEHPDMVTLETLGASVHGHPIRALTIERADDDSDGELKSLTFNGGLHAREWIGVMVPLCVADRLVRGSGDPDTDARIEDALDTTRFHIAPLINPDGYRHAWTKDRYWRKNRAAPHGVDLNRNYSVGFGGRGSSSTKRSQIYRGPHAFSEPETRAVRELLTRHKPDAHIDFHSYGQLLLYPWSYTGKPAPDEDRFRAVGDRLASAIYAAGGQSYKLLSGAGLYLAGGTLMDYSYQEAGALAYTIELRPDGSPGFVLPPDQIVPTCEESLAAVLELSSHL